MTDCPHPAPRLYLWYAPDPDGEVTCVGCCDCGAVLLGAPEPRPSARFLMRLLYQEWDKRMRQPRRGAVWLDARRRWFVEARTWR